MTIRDTGKGIAEDDLPRIFDPYFTTRRAGTGLGLAIAKNIVEGLGGSISVATRPGAGTDFRIDIGDAPTGPKADGRRRPRITTWLAASSSQTTKKKS